MARPKSDDRKTSAELGAEIEELSRVIARKQKLCAAAERREKAEAEQIRAAEEAEFNRKFVAKAREVHWGDCANAGQTVYETIRRLIRPEASPRPEQTGQAKGSLMGPYMEQLGFKTEK